MDINNIDSFGIYEYDDSIWGEISGKTIEVLVRLKNGMQKKLVEYSNKSKAETVVMDLNDIIYKLNHSNDIIDLENYLIERNYKTSKLPTLKKKKWVCYLLLFVFPFILPPY